ncbi:lysophospholipid acyltransferase family protein, partial [bacterium]|nr:lysophospholipid acyltransferase family protein [bacterium]
MARSKETTLSHRLEYGAGRVLQGFLCLMPAGVGREMGAALGTVAWSLFGIRKRVTLDQLEHALGDTVDERQRVRIGRESYRNFGRMTFEYARFPRLTPAAIERTVTLTGREHIDRALKAGGGAIIVSGHFGNWELFATLATMGYPVTFLVGEQHNLLVDGLMNRLRARFGGEIVPLTGSLRGIFRALKGNRLVVMLSDQDAGKRGVFVEFLGRPASTPYGAGRFAAATGAPLLPGLVVRHGRDKHEIVIGGPISLPDTDLDTDERVRLLTQGYTSFFEQFIRR